MPPSPQSTSKTETDAPLRVLYIMGAGRSGSTVLDTILGNHPEIVSVGELCNLHRSGWQSNEYCACGQPGSDCGFWSQVRQRWEARTGASIADYIQLQREIEDFGPRQWLKLGWDRLQRTSRCQQYLDQTLQVYEAIAHVSGKRIIVDSSKTPIRAALLARIPALDVRMLHLVRDCRAVAWSRKKAFNQDMKAGITRATRPRPVWYSAAFWTLVNVLSASVTQFQRDKSLLVRYEDFVMQPDQVLGRISELADVDLSQVARAITSGAALDVGHTIAGNRMRMSGSVKLRADLEWTTMLPSRERRMCWKIAGCLLQQYHYSR
jgi:hypothetical protein